MRTRVITPAAAEKTPKAPPPAAVVKKSTAKRKPTTPTAYPLAPFSAESEETK